MQKLIEMSKEINKKMRNYYRQTFAGYSIPCKPFGGSSRESIGPWPEIIYKGTICPRSTEGSCSPCGYSNVPEMVENRIKLNKSILFQTQFILKFFDEIILQNQRRKKPYPDFHRIYSNGEDCMFALTTTGSFFSEAELDKNTRTEILNMMVNYFNDNRINAQVYIEAHAHDVIEFYQKGYFDEIIDHLYTLNTVIIIGLESVDSIARNILYCKQLSKEDFENAINIIQNKLKLVAGAFVFVGHHSMNDYETIEDVRNTLLYLKNKNIMPVIMINNLKPYTMNTLLYKYERYSLPDPRTILEIVKMLKELSPEISKAEKWLTADPVGGPPQPEIHPFNDPRKITCDGCSDIIYKAIFGDYNLNDPNGLRETYDWKKFEEKLSTINDCECNEKYCEILKKYREYRVDLLERAEANIKFAFEKVEVYCDELSRK